MLSELELREKVQYRGLLRLVQDSGETNLDLKTHRYKAVRRSVTLGYYSSLSLACATVDGTATLPSTAKFTWCESPLGRSGTYVLDTHNGLYYAHRLKDPYPEAESEERASGEAA
jgi:hypothetical protein